MRDLIIAGNWKMNKNLGEIQNFFENYAAKSSHLSVTKNRQEVILAPGFIGLEKAVQLGNKMAITVAAQNCHFEKSGAFTGEISISMLNDIGVKTIIIGHSERRQFFGETSESVAKKALAIINSGSRPIICIGESLAERQSGQTKMTLEKQLAPVLDCLDTLSNAVFAYEPVWAIGTGLSASDEQAQEAHEFIRNLLTQKFPQEGPKTRILYGGSVKPSNIKNLLQQSDIDGALIGGSSLDVSDFIQIVEISSHIT